MLQAEGCRDRVEVSLLLTNDERIHELNRQYRKVDRPTDVLSFSQIEQGRLACDAEGAIGDIVISVETARRQAVERGGDPDDEMDLLAAHGLLHLLGYEDDTEAGAEDIRRRETALLGVEITA